MQKNNFYNNYKPRHQLFPFNFYVTTECGIQCENGGTRSLIACECNCPPGFSGATCSDNIDECEGVVCENGECNDSINAFVCICEEGFNGTFCENNINDCEALSVVCKNGECVDQISNFTCVCVPDFTGRFCEFVIDDCEPNSCSNGQCIDGNQSFTCNCTDTNFLGDLCDECNLPNCAVCSSTLGFCNSCESGFVADMGLCGKILNWFIIRLTYY